MTGKRIIIVCLGGIEINVALRKICVILFEKCFDHLNEFRNTARRRLNDIGSLDIQLCAIGKECVLVEFGNFKNRFLFSLCTLEHLILARVAVAGQMSDVGDVHDAGYVISAVTEGFLQNVLHDVSTEVADMSKMINRRTAGVHFYLAGFVGNEFLDGFGKCVVKFHL